MAQYTPSSGDYCRPYRSPWGAFPTRQFPTLSTQTAQVFQGTVMTLGTVLSSAANVVIPSTTVGTPPNLIVGVLAERIPAFTSSAVTPPTVMVWEANPNVEFVAVSRGGAQASSIVGLRKSLSWDSTLNVVMIDLTASTAADWRVILTQATAPVGNNGAAALGDSGGYVAFRFIGHLAGQTNSTIESSTPTLAFYS